MLRYLVDPIFQVINTAGKPATGGYIEVYLHGTRDKYYCASDFNGTLHPFKIPLDSLGANIILADDANAYDIYVYNRYGSLLMSRYNVAPVQGGGSGGLTPADIVPLILKRGNHTVGSYSPLEQEAKTIDIGDSIVYVTEQTENLHAAITGYLAREITPVLVKSDTDPDTPSVTRDFYFYPTARTGVDSDYSFIGYDGEVIKVATVRDDDTVTYTTYGEFLVDETPTKNSKNLVESGGVYEDVKDFRNFFVAKYGETTYAEVREAVVQNKKIICIKDYTVYTFAFISNNVYEFAGSVASNGTFKVVKVASPDVWTTESHNVEEFSVYRKEFDNLNPASATLTATDISRGYIEFDLDLGFPGGWIASWCGNPTIIIGIPGRPWQSSGKSMLKEVFTKVILYAKTTEASGLIATGIGNLNSTDDGRPVLDGNVTWNRMFTGFGIKNLELQGFTARCYLNMNSSIEWTAGLKVEFYIHFTVIL